jgi:AcrR family transcriptional regulator
MSSTLSDSARDVSGSASRDTKDRLLDAAERLFATRGFDGTSIRAVALEAGASVSAANYHFGSKEALVQHALVRRMRPLCERRLAALTAAEQAGGDQPLAVATIVEAFLRPGYEAERDSPESQTSYRTVAAQIYTDPHEMLSAIKIEIFAPVIARFIDALERALPLRTREELALDFQFLIGVMIHAISAQARNPEEGVAVFPNEHVLHRMVAFISAGLRSTTATGAEPIASGDER